MRERHIVALLLLEIILAKTLIGVGVCSDALRGELIGWRGKAVASECRGLAGSASRIEVAIHDLEQAGAAEAMVEAALKTFGRVDILVNNAAVRARKRFEQFTRKDFRQTVAVNLESPFFASQVVIPAMRQQGGGRIIHIASHMGLVAADDRALYGMTRLKFLHHEREVPRCIKHLA